MADGRRRRAGDRGLVFFAWQDDREIESFARLGAEATEAKVAGYRRALELVRANGYVIAREVFATGAEYD